MIKTTIITSAFKSDAFINNFFNELAGLGNDTELELLCIFITPTEIEKEAIHKWSKTISNLRCIQLESRENLYATWNRGIREAKGKYIGIWNTDDIRIAQGLYEQINILDSKPAVGLVYGDIYYETNYGSKTGTLKPASDSSDQTIFLKGCHLSCFPLWRKEIHKKVGYFDEQFKIVGDWDFQIRLANFYRIEKVNGPLGWYLIANRQKLSSNIARHYIEHTVLGIRYRNFKIIHLFFLLTALTQYRPFQYLYTNEDGTQTHIDVVKGKPVNRNMLYPILGLLKDPYILTKKYWLRPMAIRIGFLKQS